MIKKIIFVIRSAKGNADSSDAFLYDALSSISEEITVVLCGEFHSIPSCMNSKKEIQNIYFRQFDYPDYKILNEVIEHDEHLKFSHSDELIFVNNSIFGPFYNLKTIITAMEREDCDFWAMAKREAYINTSWEEKMEYLRMFFCVFRYEMLLSKEIRRYLKKDFSQNEFEEEFTHVAHERGYKYKAYVDVKNLIEFNPVNSFDYLNEMSYELIKNYHYPFLNKDHFVYKRLSYGNGVDLKKTIHYIKEKHLYNIDTILETALQKYNITALKDALNLEYIFPKSCISIFDQHVFLHTAVIMHIAYRESLIDIGDYIIEIPELILKVFIVINDEMKIIIKKFCIEHLIMNYEIRVMMPNRGRDMNGLLVVSRDILDKYTYVCFVHDKRTSNGNGAWIIGKTFMNQLWENTLKSSDYIAQVLKLLCENKYLGYLTTPAPYYGNYIEIMGKEWTTCFETTKELAKNMNINVDISETWSPFGLGNAFWCKTEIFRKILDFGISTQDFPDEPIAEDGTINHALERLFIYAAQDAGFYSAIIENNEFAENRMASLNYMTTHLVSEITDSPALAGRNTFEEILVSLNKTDFDEFIRNTKSLYIFGTGVTGKRCAGLLKKKEIDFEGFVCSDGFSSKGEIMGYSVHRVSEVDLSSTDTGVIIAVNKKFYLEVRNTIYNFKCRKFFL